MGDTKVTRRELIGAAGAAGLVGCAGVYGSEIAMAQEASGEVVPDIYSCDGGESTAAPIPPVAPPEHWDEEYDVVVVGAGGGGLNAALRAAELGASVLCVEKTSRPGGSTMHAGGWVCSAGGARLQNEVGYAMPSFPFDPEVATDYYAEIFTDIDRDLLHQLIVKGPECIDWMEDMGFEWGLDPNIASQLVAKGALDDGYYPLKAKIITDFSYEQSVARGAAYAFETICEALVYDGERVVGIRVNDIYGENERFIRAEKGVILTAGGCCSNRSLLRELMPLAYRYSTSSFALPGDTGECIRMCMGLDADMEGYGSFVPYDGGLLDYEYGTGPWHRHMYAQDNVISRQPWLLMNAAGERIPYIMFVEGVDASESIHMQPLMIMKQPGMRAYMVFDSKYEEYIPKMAQIGWSRPAEPDDPGIETMPEWIATHDWRIAFNQAVERGAYKKADTLEEVAELIGLDPADVVATVNRFNEACEKGVDEEFGYMPEWLNPIVEPPFYGIATGGQMMATNAGVRVNPNMQVITKRGKAIPGLYAGFHTAGGAIGRNFMRFASVLGELGLSFTSGYIAAGHVMGEE